MPVYIIGALSENKVIGKKGKLPWYLPEDLKNFKKLTTGNVVVMGRKTYESILSAIGKPLPDRVNIVLTRDKKYKVFFDNVFVCNSVEDAIEKYKDKTVYVIGGEAVYSQFIDKADKMFLSYVKGRYDGDAFFPDFDLSEWQETKRVKYDKFDFVELNRIKYGKK